MELSLLVAKVISLIYLALGIGILIKTVDFKMIVDELQNSKILLFLAGAIATALGMILVEKHNIWFFDWRLIITLVSWGMLLGGILLVMMPQLFIRIVRRLAPLLGQTLWMGMFMVIFGLVMGYFGFIYE